MRKQIAAANWKMNLTLNEAESLLKNLAESGVSLAGHQQVIIAVPFPYLILAKEKLQNVYDVGAQNCHAKESGAYTGEVSAAMLHSCGIEYVILGHSERREYFSEGFEELAHKVDICLKEGVRPIFCCGEPLEIREQGKQNEWVEKQLRESLFHVDATQLKGFIIAYEPIWAIGTGKTATADQAQEMHAHIRAVFAKEYGDDVANSISILYGGSVKAANAADIFGRPDVDGGLVGGASLNAGEFTQVIQGLK